MTFIQSPIIFDNNCFAAETQRLPGPTTLSHLGIVFVPNATAAIAWAPPHLYTFLIPAISAATNVALSTEPSISEGVVENVNVKIGDKVKAGDIIAEIETDKATMEVEAVDEAVSYTHLTLPTKA